MRKLSVFTGLSVCALLTSSAAFGAVVSFKNVANGVWNSGLNSGATVLSGGSVDPHYVIIPPATCSGATVSLNCSEDGTTTNGFGPSSYVVLGPNGTYPLVPQAWPFGDSAVGTANGSAWLGPRANETNPTVGGTTFPNVDIFGSATEFYVYRLVFNLTALGLDPFTANIQLQWIADNNDNANGQSSQIRLCTVASAASPVCAASTTVGGLNSTVSQPQAQNATSFGNTITINSGYGAGLMALDFIVYNSVIASGNNPSGARVNIVSANASTPSGVPEPATWALFGVGFLALRAYNGRKH